MSELKAIRSGEIYNIIEYEDCYRTDDLYYPKSEADNVIAELEESHKMEVEQLLIEIYELKETLKNSRNAHKYWRKEFLIEYKECLRHKYKRCLAMARCCESELYQYPQFGEQSSEERRLQKWLRLWLAIAEKLKEAR